MIAARAFLEYAQVFDNYYGTGRSSGGGLAGRGRDVVLEIDWQGGPPGAPRAARTASRSSSCRRRATRCAQRLQARRTDSPEVIERRLRDAVGDMSHYGEFDYRRGQRGVRARGGGPAAHRSRPDAAYGPDRAALAPVLRNLLA